MKRTLLVLAVVLMLIPVFRGVAVRADWAEPHLIGNLPGIQMFGAVAYNWRDDEYFVVYHGPATDTGNSTNPVNREPFADEEFSKACGAVVKPDGQVQYAVTLTESDDENSLNLSAIGYNVRNNSYAVTLRHDEPSVIDLRYLNSSGGNMAAPQRISDKGGEQQVEYSIQADRFLVRWNWTPSNQHGYRPWEQFYFMAPGQPSGSPFATQTKSITPGSGGDVSYNLQDDTYLFAYHSDGASGENEADVRAKILDSNGTILRHIDIDTGRRDQASAHVAYSWSTNEWLVTHHYHNGPATTYDLKAAVVDAQGNVKKQFYIRESKAWDAPGPVGYDPTTDRFIVTWREADDIWMVAVNPHTYAIEDVIPGREILAPVIQSPQLGAMVVGMDIRLNDQDPQALVLWTDGFGLTGIRGTIVHLRDGKQTVIHGGGNGCLDEPPTDDSGGDGLTAPPDDDDPPLVGDGTAALACSPANLDVERSEDAEFEAIGGDGEYRWTVRSSAGEDRYTGNPFIFNTSRGGIYRVGLRDGVGTETSCLLTVGTSFSFGDSGNDTGDNGTGDDGRGDGSTDGIPASDSAATIAGRVMTGPFGAVILAGIVAFLFGGLYLSYTHSDRYRSREIDELRRSRDPLDFRN